MRLAVTLFLPFPYHPFFFGPVSFFLSRNRKKSFFSFFFSKLDGCIASHNVLPFFSSSSPSFFSSYSSITRQTYTTTEKARGNPLNTYEEKRRKIAQARLLFIITYRICERAYSNIQNISFVRAFVCSFIYRSVFFSTFFFLLVFIIYRRGDWHTRYSITHGSNHAKTWRYST